MKRARARARRPAPDRAELFRQRGRVQSGRSATQLAPQNSLPIFSATAFPIEDHLRSKREILIEGARDLARELEASQLRTGPFKVASQLGKLTLGEERRKQLHDPPGEIFARVKAGGGSTG